MPNWCSTTMVVRGSERELKLFSEAYARAQETAKEKGWSTLYALFAEFGYSEGDFSSKFDRSRGDITGFYRSRNGGIRVDYESAWTPNISAFDCLFSEKFETLSQVSLAEEPGCGVYINTDEGREEFPDSYYLEFDDEDIECDHYHPNEESVVEAMSEALGRKFSSIGQCLAYAERSGGRVRLYEFAPM